MTAPAFPPSRPCPDISVEIWEPSLDPCAISREASAPSPWMAGSLAALVALVLGLGAALVPWRQPRRSRVSLPPWGRHTVALALREVPPAERDPISAPGGGKGQPQWAPVPTPGLGGIGDLNALPTVKSLAPQGDLSTPSPSLAPTPLGGGLSPRLGVAGGSPMGVAGGQGGGSRRGQSPSPGADLPTASAKAPTLTPVHRQDISYTLPKGSAPARIIVIVRALVLMDGTVKSVTFVEGPLPLKERAEAAALQWRFRPLAASGFQEPVYVNIHFDSALSQRRM